jgi:alkylation response protein AidB-like acyl-CoA dehydrogenase
VVGGVFAPTGRAVTGADAFTVTGRWRFASNVENCDWLMAGCVVLDAGEPRMLAGGRPDVRLMLFPAARAEVIDTWRVAGLRGTGSHDFALDGLDVPASRSASLITDTPRAAGALYAFPPFGLLAAAIAAVALGIARAALDDLTSLAADKTPAGSTRRLADRAVTQSRVAHAEAAVTAARALLFAAVGDAWEEARRGGAMPLGLRARLRIAASHAVETCAASVSDVYHLAGGGALYETSPLQRRFRDIHAATQHMLVGPGTWELAGRVLLGNEVDDSQL